jgi:hypothetical protein
MGYFIKHLPLRKSAPNWKVQFVSYKKADLKPECRAKKPKREWDIKRPRWQELGISTFMTIEEARARAKQLNAQDHLRKQEEQLRKLNEERIVRQHRYDATMPSEFVAEFESRFVRKRDSQTEQGIRRTSRALITWRSAQRMIAHVSIEPSEWFIHSDKIYDYFFAQKMSVKYMQSVMRMANLWGFFISRKMARPFLPVSSPQGYERQRIVDASFTKTKGVTRASKPISPRHLREVWGTLNRRNCNWLRLSVWFGLRPQEIDRERFINPT